MASVIVQIVHEMVRDAIADVLAKLATKLAATALTAGVAAIWAVPSLASDVFKWATRLEREVTAVVRSASSLGDVFKRATTLMDNLSDGLKGLGPHPAMANMGPVPHTPRTPSTPRAGRTPPRAGGGGKGGSGKGAGKGGQSPRSPQPKPQPKTVDPKPVIGGKSNSKRRRKGDEPPRRAQAEPKPKTDPRDGVNRGDGRDHKGQYAEGNKGAKAYAKSEWEAVEKYRIEMEREGTPLREIISDNRKARVEGAPNGRFYDRIIQREDGTWVGIEVKSGSAHRGVQQKAFDSLVSPDNPARVKLPDGRVIEITEVELLQAPRQY